MEKVLPMKKFTVFLALCLFTVAAAGCGKKASLNYTFKYQKDPAVKALLKISPAYPAARFVVFSDPHYHDPSLGTGGKAFDDYLLDDRKLLKQSGELLDAGIRMIIAEKPDFILLPGDLTKDGERVNHEKVKQKIDALARRIPKIYLVPGNHDVLNGEARSYRGDTVEPVESITPDDFKKIYAAYGYTGPLAADKSSLSYVVEPVKGLWVLALDSCLWRDQKPGKPAITDGEFSTATLQWIEDVLIRAKKEKKALMAFMHHGIVEHYPHNEKFYGEYIVNHAEAVAGLFAAYGVKLVFTGHFHAQDITVMKQDAGRVVYDIETGSFVTYPCPFRVVSIDRGRQARIESRFISSIPSMKEGFREYARGYLFNGTVKMAEKALKGYHVSKKDMKVLCPLVADAYVTHLTGEEKTPAKMFPETGLGFMGKLVIRFQGNLIRGWYTDLTPADHRIVIDLTTGEWK